MADESCVSIESRDGVTVVSALCPDMDDERTTQLQDETAAAAVAAPQQPVVIDLTRVEFIPSLSLAALVTLLRGCKSRGQRLALAGVQANVRGALAVTHLDRLFEIYDTLDEACERLRARPA